MIQPARSEEITDEEFAEYMKPFEEKMKKLAIKYAEDFFVDAIGIAYEMNCIFADSNIKYEYADSKEYLSNVYYNDIDLDRIKKEVLKKYSLKVIKDKPIKIEKIQP